MKDKHPLDEYFKRELEGHRTAPSASVWEKIEAGTDGAKAGNKGGWYLLRAAVVTLLLALSTWVFYWNNGDTVIPEHPIAHQDANEENTDKNPEKQAETTTVDSKKQDKTEKKEDKKDRVIPIMKVNTRQNLYVSNEPLIPVNEETLQENQQTTLSQVELNVSKLSRNESAPVHVKIKLSPATTPAFYANAEKPGETQNEEEKLTLVDRLYAYGNSQFDNLKSGKRLELPKLEKKPQLEINLGKIFNN